VGGADCGVLFGRDAAAVFRVVAGAVFLVADLARITFPFDGVACCRGRGA